MGGISVLMAPPGLVAGQGLPTQAWRTTLCGAVVEDDPTRPMDCRIPRPRQSPQFLVGIRSSLSTSTGARYFT